MARAYEFRMVIDGEGPHVTGKTYIHVRYQPKIYGVMEFHGRINGNELIFEETQVTDQKITENWEWCLKEGRLLLDTTDNETWTLSGHWSGSSYSVNCIPGLIFTSRPAPEKRQPEEPQIQERAISEQHDLKVRARTVQVSVWDSDKVDGDVVSLMFNGEWVVRNKKLKKKKFVITLVLAPEEENILVLHAENEGKVPPNTAMLTVYDGSEYRRLSLKSDMVTSGAIRFRLEK